MYKITFRKNEVDEMEQRCLTIVENKQGFIDYLQTNIVDLIYPEITIVLDVNNKYSDDKISVEFIQDCGYFTFKNELDEGFFEEKTALPDDCYDGIRADKFEFGDTLTGI